MTNQSLSYFLAVYEERSITRAAKKLYVSQQNLSAHIQRLEEECGCPLFRRRPSFVPTLAAERLEKTARRILRMQKEVLSEIQDIASQKRGQISIGCSSYIAESHIGPLLCEFFKLHSDCSISTSVEISRRLEQMTTDGTIDLFLSSYLPKSPLLAAVFLFNLPLSVMVRKQTFLSHTGLSEQALKPFFKHGISLKQLAPLPLILPCRGWRLREILDSYFEEHTFSPNILLETQHSNSYLISSEGFGAGISCFIPPPKCQDSENPLLYLPLSDIEYSLQANACYRKDHYLTSYEQDFLEVTRKYFAAIQDIGSVLNY
ncbi:MAG: LysR family transcriptional regulator [Lachnospiraceae bacterium]|nr:LysR family transcriptional regulator [Lachnospiraceae bacterium]